MAWAQLTVANATAGNAILATDHAQAFENINVAGAAWSSFTPTLSGGWALGNSTVEAKYVKFGRIVHFYAAITLGSTSTRGTTLYAALPVTASSANAAVGITAYFNNVTGTGAGVYPAHAVMIDTGKVELTTLVANQTYVLVTGVAATVPFGENWAAGDIIYYAGTYEAASV